MSSTPASNESTNTASLTELRASLDTQIQRQDLIRDFITSQLQEGTDFGTITIGGRASKPTLFKPGMEKIFSLFSVVSTLERDSETIEMINKVGVIAYKCTLTRNGEFIGEGRGACDIAEKSRINDAIKIAEKRARMDACLNLGFSEYFTQDLEDLPEATPADTMPAKDESPRDQYHLTFTIQKKEELVAQSGNPYARMQTDKGTVIAFKNTLPIFQEGGTYLAQGVEEKRNGSRAFVVTGPGSTIEKL